MSISSRITIGSTSHGYVIGVHGRGTYLQSPGFQKLADDCLRDECTSVAIDLSKCEFLDSTFLGCLVTLHRKYGHPGHVRIRIVASPEHRRNLLHVSRLDSVFEFLADPPETIGTPVEVDVMIPDREDLARHIAESHRRLAERGGPEAADFERIAQSVSEEIARK